MRGFGLIGVVFDTMGKLDSAMSHFKISMKIDDQLQEKREMILVRKSMASLYFKQGDSRTANDLAQQSIADCQRGQLPKYHSRCLFIALR